MLEDVVHDSKGQTIPITLHRLNPPINLISPRTSQEGLWPDQTLPSAPPRPPSSLPQQCNLTLRTFIAEYLGSGRTGLVYALRSPFLSDAAITSPDLVFKFARSHRCADLYRESWFYDEMECLQGVAVPRCFGLFEATIPDGCGVQLPDGSSLLENEDSESPDAEVDENTTATWISQTGYSILHYLIDNNHRTKMTTH